MIQPFASVFNSKEWRTIVFETLEMYEGVHIQKKQPPLEILLDKAMFRNAFAKFRKHRRAVSLKKQTIH
jgi:hypothetical protein